MPMYTAVAVRNLLLGDVLAGSKFTVTRKPYMTVGLADTGQVRIEGFYPGQPTRSYDWNGSTTVHIINFDA